ncbi:MAG: hypothetical protein ABIT36_08085 [Steroidobacteraceae bacterium]
MKTADAIVTLTQLGRGERPWSLQNRETEEVLNISLALLMEVTVAYDRIDRLERLLAERTGLTLDALRATDYAPQSEAARERQECTDALLARVLRIRLDPRTGNTSQPA